MKKLALLLIIVVVVCLAVSLSACVADKSRTQFVYDQQGIFSETQLSRINEACRQATKKYGVTIMVATCHRTGTKADINGEQFLRSQGLSERDDYVIVLINAQDVGVDYHFDVYTYGRAASRISDSEIDDIIMGTDGDAILTSDSANATGGVVNMTTSRGKAYDGIPLWGNIVIGIVVGLAVASFVAWRIARGYSRQRKNVTYPLDKYCQMRLKDREDQFMRSTTTVVVINDNSGGSGGGSHSSGGGGGGGHRGGR